ncbi:hypothetical protein BRADI_3g14776v3 [Brachypodium distachyon]|uniref:Uncharacterized protein n=1 Tax=Brachypodium distachyon TaxID=15368 RepID=A0A0Q3F5T2_BRADI|nr:hypothetical protein BRADI_3g14776v3 [Brachypodium distachyon]
MYGNRHRHRPRSGHRPAGCCYIACATPAVAVLYRWAEGSPWAVPYSSPSHARGRLSDQESTWEASRGRSIRDTHVFLTVGQSTWEASRSQAPRAREQRACTWRHGCADCTKRV